MYYVTFKHRPVTDLSARCHCLVVMWEVFISSQGNIVMVKYIKKVNMDYTVYEVSPHFNPYFFHYFKRTTNE